MRQKQASFTLIELLVVMAILGILATVGLVSFRTAQLKGRDARRKHDLEQIQKALEMYFNDKGHYPPTDELPSGGNSWQDTSVADGALYMKEMPSDPKEGSYCYYYDITDGWYRLYAKLENENDPAIAKTGCSSGCSCGGDDTYNYKVTSTNAP